MGALQRINQYWCTYVPKDYVNSSAEYNYIYNISQTSAVDQVSTIDTYLWYTYIIYLWHTYDLEEEPMVQSTMWGLRKSSVKHNTVRCAILWTESLVSTNVEARKKSLTENDLNTENKIRRSKNFVIFSYHGYSWYLTVNY